MGGAESKVGLTASSIMPYKDAAARFDELEMKMISDAVRKFGIDNTSVDRASFLQCSLATLPPTFQARVYRLFGGGSKSISFADIVCGLALLLKGTVDERKKFVFALYDVRNEGVLTEQGMTSCLLPEDDKDSISTAFAKEPTMDFASFERWMGQNPTATGWLEWVMFPTMEHYSKSQIPTDIDMLTQMTHFTRAEAEKLEARYVELKTKFQGKGKKMVAASLQPLACPPLTPGLLARLCYLWGERDNGEVEFREVLFGISVCCRGTDEEILKFIFKIFDIGNKKFLSVLDLSAMFDAIGALGYMRSNKSSTGRTTSAIDKRTLSLCSVTSKDEFEAGENDSVSDSSDGEGDEDETDIDGSDPFRSNENWTLTIDLQQAIDAQSEEERNGLRDTGFIKWAKNGAMFDGLRKALATVGQTVFALRPRTHKEERMVVQTQMQDDHLRNVTQTHGTMCNIVASSWFQSWKEYIGIERVEGSNQQSSAPGPIDNNSLSGRSGGLTDAVTSRGSTRGKAGPGGLKRNLVEDRDFVVLSDLVFSMLHHWYGGGPVIARPIIAHGNEEPRIEVYPLNIKVLHHQASKVPLVENSKNGNGKLPHVSFLLYVECSRTKTVLHLAKLICAKQRSLRKGIQDLRANSVRLWNFDDQANPSLLQSENTLVDFRESLTILLEVRNDDMSWPSELFALAKGKKSKFSIDAIFGSKSPQEEGMTGLSNLGNTCYMNAALQCVSNTDVLREYFQRKCHLLEINEANKMGTKGAIAKTYGNLIRRLWQGKMSVAPVDMRSVLVKYSSQFAGYEQHDSQELLACLLDGLHEDLNRIKNPPYVERKDSDGRPDHIVAMESWEGHLKRSQSVIVDLFQGLLKSRLTCKKCSFESVSFDPFTFLTLPLPTDDLSVVNINFTRLEGNPVHCSIRVPRTATIGDLKVELKKIFDCDTDRIVFVEYPGLSSERTIGERTKLRSLKLLTFQAFEIVPSTTPVPEKSAKSQNQSKRKRGSSPEVESRKPAKPAVDGHCFAVHRKQVSFTTHFLTDTSTFSIFGTPVLVPCESCTNQDLYKFVWKRVSYVMEPDYREKVDSGEKELPFVLTQLSSTRTNCSKCSWARFCSGCVIPQSDEPYSGNAIMFGIDWNPRELCLHGNATKEAVVTEHESVEEVQTKENEPIDLAACLADYTKEEDMGKDDLWYCPKCKEHVEAKKKLDIWSLPPVLIIHLKRFQMVNGRWVKSQRQVNFPLDDFDIYKHLKHPKLDPRADSLDDDGNMADASKSTVEEPALKNALGDAKSASEDNHTVVENIEKLDPHSKFYEDPSCSRVYDLSAMTIHLGIMGGGHYVAYGKNPNGKWCYYNDSSCKEAPDERVRREHGYYLFYTARGLCSNSFMADGTPPLDESDTSEQEDTEGDDTEKSKRDHCTIS